MKNLKVEENDNRGKVKMKSSLKQNSSFLEKIIEF